MTSFVIAVLVLAIVGVFLGVKVVPQGHRFTVERFGRFTRIQKPGKSLVSEVLNERKSVGRV